MGRVCPRLGFRDCLSPFIEIFVARQSGTKHLPQLKSTRERFQLQGDFHDDLDEQKDFVRVRDLLLSNPPVEIPNSTLKSMARL